MKIRAVLMDMDGTLLGRSQVAVSFGNMKAVQKAIEMGIHVIPCTGRVYNMLPPQLLSQKGIRYFVLSHGARVYDCVENKSLYEDLIPPAQSSELMEILEGKGLYNEIAANATVYYEKAITEPFDYSLIPEHHVWYARDGWWTAVEKPSAFFKKNGVGIEKMNLYNIPKHLQEELYEKVTATGYVEHTRPGAGPHLEFEHAGISKPDAVETLLNHLGISYEVIHTPCNPAVFFLYIYPRKIKNPIYKCLQLLNSYSLKTGNKCPSTDE